MKIRSFLILFCLFLVGQHAPFLWAGQNDAVWAERDETRFHERLEKRTHRRLRYVVNALHLTPEQKVAVEKILEDRNGEIEAQEKDFRQKRAALRNETRDKVIQVFTPGQRDLYENGEGQKGGSRLHDQQPGRYKGGGLDEE
jgi:hypothetical protein